MGLIQENGITKFEYNDFSTNERKTFDLTNYGMGGQFYLYTGYRIPSFSTQPTPIFVGTILNNGKFVSAYEKVTSVRQKTFDYSKLRVEVLDSIPGGITYKIVANPHPPSYGLLGRDIIFETDGVQYVNFPQVQNPTPGNYPINFTANPKCYFKVRIYSTDDPINIYSEWLYYFEFRINWSQIRDSFISNFNSQQFTIDNNIVDSKDFIQNQKSQGYYL